MIGIRRVIFVILLICALAGCDTHSQQDDFAEAASSPPSGFSRTDDSGDEIDADLDDWRTSPVYAGEISVRPAYPNPISSSEFVTVPITVTSFGTVYAPLRIETLRDGRLIALDQIDQAADPGAYVFTFSAAEFGSRGLRRVYIFDGAGEIVSYGDVSVN